MNLKRSIVGCRDDWQPGNHLQDHSEGMRPAHVGVSHVDTLMPYPVDDSPHVRGFAIQVTVNKPCTGNSDFLQPAIVAAQYEHLMATGCKHFRKVLAICQRTIDLATGNDL